MAEDREYFGIMDEKDFSLKKRLWARLVEKLVAMQWKKDPSQEDLYRFFSDNGLDEIILKISYKSGYECDYRQVELLDGSGNVLAEEKVFPDGIASSYAHHPLIELFDLVWEEEIHNIEELKNLAKIVQ